MIKRIICIIFAALLVFAMCACANNKKPVEPTKAPDASKVTPTPAATENVTAVPATKVPENFDPYQGLSDDTVLVAFDGLVNAGFTVAQAKQQQLTDSENADEDNPVLSGILLKDLLALVGAENAKTLTVNYDEASFAKSFDLSTIDMDTAFVYILRNGTAIGEGKCVLVLTDGDGFEYSIAVEKPLTLA